MNVASAHYIKEKGIQTLKISKVSLFLFVCLFGFVRTRTAAVQIHTMTAFFTNELKADIEQRR
jgi:hypothetical protein